MEGDELIGACVDLDVAGGVIEGGDVCLDVEGGRAFRGKGVPAGREGAQLGVAENGDPVKASGSRSGLRLLHWESGAGEAIRTPDINLGKVALYP